MSRARLTNLIFALLAVALAGGAVLLSGGAPRVSAAPPLALTATAEPPTATPVSTAPVAPSPTAPTGQTITPTAPTEPTPPAPNETPSPERMADPAVAKEANRSEASLGDEISFTITVTNEGNDTAQGVIVEDALPGYLQLISASVDKGQAVTNGNTAGLWIGDVAPGEVVRGEITARVVGVPEGGEGVNVAVLRSNNSTDRVSNNRSSARVRVSVPSPTPDPAGQPAPDPAGGAQPTPPPPAVLPATGDEEELPLGLLLLAAIANMGAGLYFWRRLRRYQ